MRDSYEPPTDPAPWPAIPPAGLLSGTGDPYAGPDWDPYYPAQFGRAHRGTGHIRRGRPAARSHPGPAHHCTGGGPADPGTSPDADDLIRVRSSMMAAPVEDIGTRTFTALGTFASLLVTDRGSLELAFGLLAGELLAVDMACSRFRTDSELWRVNHAHGHPVGISPLLTQALATALTAARITDGDVDPTCGRSLASLGYDRDFAQARRRTTGLAAPPAPAAGWQTVELDAERRTVRVPETVMLDLGATAKALAADRAAARISVATGCGVLVNLGGDIRVAGEAPAGGWRVGILDDLVCAADGSQAGPGQAVIVRDGGLATSSTRARAWQRGGTRLHHIIVPSTGLPVDSCWQTVSVAAATCVDANTASTAAILRGDQATQWLDGLGLPARLVRPDGTAVITGGWPAGPAGTGGQA
jgi:thiamine biosynthesis lipoprotein